MTEHNDTNLPRPSVGARQLVALVEVLAAMGAIILAFWLLKTFTPVPDWQKSVFGGTVLTKTVFFIFLPVLIVVITRRSPAEYGIAFARSGRHVKTGLVSLVSFVPLGVAFPLIEIMHTTYRDPLGGLILTLAELVALFLLARVLKNTATEIPTGRGASHLSAFLILVAASLVLSALAYPAVKQISVIVRLLIATGFGEEILFRGYVQSRLNAAFPYRRAFFGVPCGPGLVIAAALFGLVHWLNPGGTPWWALWTFTAGLVFGFLREKTGSVIAPAILHGLPLTVVTLVTGSVP